MKSFLEKSLLIFIVCTVVLHNVKAVFSDTPSTFASSPTFMNLGQEVWKVTNQNGSVTV